MDLVRAAYHPDATQTNPYLGTGEWGSVEGPHHADELQRRPHPRCRCIFLANIVFEFAGDGRGHRRVVPDGVPDASRCRGGPRDSGRRARATWTGFECRDGNWKIAKRVLPLNFIRPLAPAGDQILFTKPSAVDPGHTTTPCGPSEPKPGSIDVGR